MEDATYWKLKYEKESKRSERLLFELHKTNLGEEIAERIVSAIKDLRHIQMRLPFASEGRLQIGEVMEKLAGPVSLDNPITRAHLREVEGVVNEYLRDNPPLGPTMKQRQAIRQLSEYVKRL